MKLLKDSYSVWWADLRMMRHLWQRFLITSLMSPMLYLLAFGFGLGRGITVDGISYLEFVIPGIVALTAMNTSFNNSGVKLMWDRLFHRSFDEMLMAPISPFSLILGKSFIGALRGLITSSIFLIISMAISPIRIDALFAFTLLLTCFTFSFMGVLAALLARTYQDMPTFTSLVLLPMTFLGGTFFPLDQLPEVLRVILHILPLTHASQCLRAAILGQPFPWVSLLAIAGFGLAFFLGCVLKLRRMSV
ncbi:ABC transporter permease [Dehalococcoidia bacterium]|nr:ABC transporter permease [Dehalococcoidia bacterium]